MNWLVFFLRRLIAPAALAGFMANIALYQQLGTPVDFFDMRSIGMLTGIALVGITVSIPEFLVLGATPLAPWIKALLVIVIGVVNGVLGMALIAWGVEADDLFGYNNLGAAAGVVTALAWLAINFDLLRRGARD